MLVAKLMWLPDRDIFWDVVCESSVTDEILSKLSPQIRSDLDLWYGEYGKEYHQWLAGKGSAIYDVGSKLVEWGVRIVAGIQQDIAVHFYYWFDIDRSETPKYTWLRCPMCKEILVDHAAWHSNNRYCCDHCRLILPSAGGLHKE